jgi:hypothetical protein
MQSVILSLAAVMTTEVLAPEQATQAEAEAKRAEVLVLGVYHIANPGRDIFNMQADDVLSPKRQQEIAQLAAVLKRFQPTRIAVEAPYGEDVVPQRYAEHLAGTRPLSRNEVEQIGFRLAKDLGHAAIYPVDVEGDFPFQRIVNYAKATGESAELQGMMGEIGEMVKAQGEYLKTHTVLETLLYMNADAKVAQDVGFYHLQARYGEPGDYAGPDLLAEWYRRNVRIYNNVAKRVATPEDRVLVIFGAGHLGWLRQAFAADPTMRLRKLEEFVPAATSGAERP